MQGSFEDFFSSAGSPGDWSFWVGVLALVVPFLFTLLRKLKSAGSGNGSKPPFQPDSGSTPSQQPGESGGRPGDDMIGDVHSFHVVPGTLYRALIVVSAPGLVVTDDAVRSELGPEGFAEITLWRDADALPSDWPATRKDTGAGLLQTGLYLEGKYTREERDIPPSGKLWTLKDLWVQKYAAKTPDPKTPDPTPPTGTPITPGPDPVVPPVQADPPAPDPDSLATTERPAGNLDAWAFGLVKRIWPIVFPGETPTDTQVEAVCAVSRGETVYGWPSQTQWHGHHNWGAIQHSSPKAGVCPVGSFLWKDGYIIKDPATGAESWRMFQICEKAWPTNEAGCEGFLRELLVKRPGVKDATRTGSAFAVARAMRVSKYFFRHPENEYIDADAAVYAKAITSNAAAIAKALGRKPLVTFGAGPSSSGAKVLGAVLFLGSVGGAIAAATWGKS